MKWFYLICNFFIVLKIRFLAITFICDLHCLDRQYAKQDLVKILRMVATWQLRLFLPGIFGIMTLNLNTLELFVYHFNQFLLLDFVITKLKQTMKRKNFAIFIVGHVTWSIINKMIVNQMIIFQLIYNPFIGFSIIILIWYHSFIVRIFGQR